MRPLAAVAVALLASSCNPKKPQRESVEFSAMGTTGRVTVRGPAAETGWQIAVNRVGELEGIFSHWKPRTPVSAFNSENDTEPHRYPEELVELVATSLEIHGRTGGAFDITVAPLVVELGFAPPVADRPEEEPVIGSHLIEADIENRTLRKLDPRVQIDLSAIAKGYAIDAVASRLEENGVDDYLIELGGELRAGPAGSWKVGIEQPEPGGGPVRRAVDLRGGAIATSGSYRQSKGDAHHIIDPETRRPSAPPLVAVSVLADTGAEADALATALMAMGLERGIAFAEREAIAASFVERLPDGGYRAQDTPGFPAPSP